VAAILSPCSAGAQTTTADGIQALTRGDYATAARILRPLAEDAAQPDPLALFFMATLYESGRGVALNPIRACGLYLRAATSKNPLLSQSLVLAQLIHRDLPPVRDLCAAASSYAWQDPPARSFTLGQDHWARLGREGFVVGYKGAQETAAITMGGPGWAYVLIRHTPLDVSRPVAMRRHFIEFFFWLPHTDSDPLEWDLRWMVFEVVGTDPLAVPAGSILANIVAAQPPASAPVDDLVRIRVNADGEAEWARSGPNPRSGVIPYLEVR
jgi:hypothetical protein